VSKPYTAAFLAAEKRRTAIHDHQRRIVERRRLTDHIAEMMQEAAQQVLSDLLAVYTQRQLARKVKRSPEAVSRLKNGTLECSHELFLDLFQLWVQLPKESK
jgi:hypothetical protein